MSHLSKREQDLKKISAQGKADGSDGGLLDLLTWSGKLGVREISAEEAARFLDITQHDRQAWKDHPYNS